MMQPRCAICDADSTLTVYCDVHDNTLLAEKRRQVQCGELSDWPRNTGGAVNHRDMQTIREHGATVAWHVVVGDINRRARAWLDGWQTDGEGWAAA